VAWVRIEVGNRSVPEEATILRLSGEGLPKYTEESSWEATLIAEPRPGVGGPGNRF